ncbi:hypothetical protein D9X30_3930 [Cupriavidus sp. U2]|nr:hypothetical protein D9X30_3930 [Cupriavidus sp. U2]
MSNLRSTCERLLVVPGSVRLCIEQCQGNESANSFRVTQQFDVAAQRNMTLRPQRGGRC